MGNIPQYEITRSRLIQDLAWRRRGGPAGFTIFQVIDEALRGMAAEHLPGWYYPALAEALRAELRAELPLRRPRAVPAAELEPLAPCPVLR